MLGTVVTLRRYPVKSMLGEDLDVGDVTFTGLSGDRRLAVVSRTSGKIASAKFPRLWRDLLTLSAASAQDSATRDAAIRDAGTRDGLAHDSAVRITLPEGKTVWSDDAGVDAVLSDLLDEPVTLTATPVPGAALDRAVPEAVLRDGVDAQVPAELMEIGGGGPPGTFVDFAPLHLLTTSTLDRIAGLSPHGRADLERYRPNIVIRTATTGFTENDWLDRILRVGGDLVLRVIARTPRCAVPTLAHGALPRDPDALRVLARHNRVEPLDSVDPEPCAGVYAEVLRPGRIRTGDPVRLA
ncbi:MAG TPA: MOSC domain-containing protein [Streptosporangiaceae bacterium]|nr:MOSC domain-containing protein [Streptosporangiaceae bacterium]